MNIGPLVRLIHLPSGSRRHIHVCHKLLIEESITTFGYAGISSQQGWPDSLQEIRFAPRHQFK